MLRTAFLSMFVVLAACSFNAAQATDGGPIDAPPVGSDGSDVGVLPVVSFSAGASMFDHDSGVVHVPVSISGTVGSAVTVTVTVIGGSAVQNTDFAFSEQNLTFTNGQTQNVNITMLPVGVAEGDRTVELKLGNPQNAKLGTDKHTLTITANVLPRVSFVLATASANEGDGSASLVVKLDTPSPLPITVTVLPDGLSTATQPDDYTIPSTVTFPAGETMEPLVITIVDDQLDEDNETVIVNLVSATNAEIAPDNNVDTLTIVDDDAPPTVAFTASAGSAAEGIGTVTLTVQLSAPSGRTVTVPFAADPASTADDPADYTYQSTAPLSFAPGETSHDIVVAVVQDTVDEDDETVITNLDPNPTNATVLAGGGTNTLTILDDDEGCFGPADNFQVCFDRGPEPGTTAALPAAMDTDLSTLCSPTQPKRWTTTQGEQPACVVIAETITSATNVIVTGSRPLVVVASGTLTLGATLEGSSTSAGRTGPGEAFQTACAPATADTNGTGGLGGGGGAGGSFGSLGGNGGSGASGAPVTTTTGGTAGAAISADPLVLLPGCDGEVGGNGVQPAANAGQGGGVIYLIAGTLDIHSSIINVSGSGGAGGGHFSGGSGGGSGGMIKLFGGSGGITTTASTHLVANGGGGSSGAITNKNGQPGGDPSELNPSVQAAGGSGMGTTPGGNGFAGGTAAVNGTKAPGPAGGGAGGGGGGFIASNLTLPAALVSGGRVNIP